MAIALYMDEHVQEDGRGAADDDVLIKRARELGRVIFSEDDDMLSLASRYQRTSLHFAGVIHTNFQKKRIGYYVKELELICKACELPEFENAVQYI